MGRKSVAVPLGSLLKNACLHWLLRCHQGGGFFAELCAVWIERVE